MTNLIKIKNLTKDFKKTRALDNLSFDVNEGEIIGIIGQNGAGKSTLFRCMLDYIDDYQGEILYKDEPIRKIKLNKLGFLPEERSLFDKSTVIEQIKYFASLNNYKVNNNEIKRLFDYYEIKGKPTDKIKNLSKGNVQKVQLLCTLFYKPDIVILDEPFSGLDPYNIKLLQQIILDYKKTGNTILYSSHNMENVEIISDRLLMLKNGKRELYGTIEEIRNEFERLTVYVECDDDLSFLREYDFITELIFNKEWKIGIKREEDAKELFEILHDRIGFVRVFNQRQLTLNEIFNKRVKA